MAHFVGGGGCAQFEDGHPSELAWIHRLYKATAAPSQAAIIQKTLLTPSSTQRVPCLVCVCVCV